MTLFSYPERGGDREELVARFKVVGKMQEGVMLILLFAYNYAIAFEVLVGLVMR